MYPDYKSSKTEELKRAIEKSQDANSLAERLQKAQQEMDKIVKRLSDINSDINRKKSKKYID